MHERFETKPGQELTMAGLGGAMPGDAVVEATRRSQRQRRCGSRSDEPVEYHGHRAIARRSNCAGNCRKLAPSCAAQHFQRRDAAHPIEHIAYNSALVIKRVCTDSRPWSRPSRCGVGRRRFIVGKEQPADRSRSSGVADAEFAQHQQVGPISFDSARNSVRAGFDRCVELVGTHRIVRADVSGRCAHADVVASHDCPHLAGDCGHRGDFAFDR